MTNEEKVIDIIVEQLCRPSEKAKVALADNLKDDLGADSLDAVELIMALEESFDVEINDERAEKVVTVQDAVDLVITLVE